MAGERNACQKRKYYNNIEKKRQVVNEKNESTKKFSKEKYMSNRASKTTYQKAMYHKHPEVQLAYEIPRNC